MYILQRRQGQLSELQFFIFFLKMIRDIDAFISAGRRFHIFALGVLIDSMSKLYSFNICSLKMITNSKPRSRIEKQERDHF